MGCGPSTEAEKPESVEASKAQVQEWCKGLRHDRDLASKEQIGQIHELADKILASGTSIEDLKADIFPKSMEYSVVFLSAIFAADSAQKLRQCPPHHFTVVHAMYNEHDRMKPFADGTDGQDFVNTKCAQMNWLYGKYAPEGCSWNYIAVDDGCPHDPPSGKLMEQVIKDNNLSNVEVVYLQTGIDEKIPPFDQMKSTKDSRKGGSILYGLYRASLMNVTGKKHICAYFDADLSADLSFNGLLAYPILADGAKVSVGQRYGCPGSFLALPKGAAGHPQSLWNNTDCHKMMFRHKARGVLMPALKGVYDTQCAFKAVDVAGLKELVPKVNAFGAGFDMELLIQAARANADAKQPLALVPFLFIEDKEGSTMTSNDEAACKSFHSMLKEMIQIHERCFADAKLSAEDTEWIKFFRELDLPGYIKMINGFKEKCGPNPEQALDYPFSLEDAKAFSKA